MITVTIILLNNSYYNIAKYLMRLVPKFSLVNNQDEIPLINQILNPSGRVFRARRTKMKQKVKLKSFLSACF